MVESEVDRDTGRRATAGASHPLVELTLCRIREFLREKEAVFWVFVFPVLLTFALGIAFRNAGPEPVAIAVNASRSGSAAVVEALAQSPDVRPLLLDQEEAERALHSGRVALVVHAPAEVGARPEPAATFEYELDPTRPESRVARLVASDALERAAGRSDILGASDRMVTEPGARYIDFLVPGLIGMNLMGSGMWGLGFSIVTARTRKVLKRLAATPMRRSHYLVSLMMSRLVFLVAEITAVLLFAWLVFGVTVRGSLVEFFVVALLGSFTFAGLGLLVAARPETIEGVSGLMNAVMLPMWLLSGTFFSAARFPDVVQPLIRLLPLTALNDSLRAIMNDGVSMATLAAPLAVLAAWTILSFVAALKIFKWQ